MLQFVNCHYWCMLLGIALILDLSHTRDFDTANTQRQQINSL